MPRAELATTTFDHEELKQSLIAFLQQKEEFEDFNFEGSAINTIIDLLTRNALYDAYMANMLANESFISSAQIRGNVSAHAQKLSYVPRSRTASRAVIDIVVTPSDTPTDPIITTQPGLVFLASVGGNMYTFTTRSQQTFSYDSVDEVYRAEGVNAYQGQFIRNRYNYNGAKIVIPNRNVDTSTLRVIVDDDVIISYDQATEINVLGQNQTVYFLRENTRGEYEISFGDNVLGNEPSNNAIITVEYINTEEQHGNGVTNLIAASTIGGYSNIAVTVTQAAYGGADRDSIERIRMLAPRVYQAQNRALAPDDYVSIIYKDFPFIQSAISWGGEDNDPPRYGVTFVSIIPEAGLEVTDTLRNQIEASIRNKSVGSVTPQVVEPNIFMVCLDVGYRLVRGLTDTPTTQIESEIKTKANDYSLNRLRRFGEYFNESYLIDQIRENNAIETVVIDETARTTLPITEGGSYAYDVNFQNPIQPGTLVVDRFRVNLSASMETITDDGNGNVVYAATVNSATTTQNIGTIDYDTGVVTFTAQFINDGFSQIRISAKPTTENFYVYRNNVVEIGTVTVNGIRLANQI